MNTTLQLMQRTMRLACPNCGYRPIFRTLFQVHLECPDCGLPLTRRQGFYLGAMCVNYGIVVFVLLPILLIGLFKEWVPSEWGIVLALVIAIVGPILVYRISWALWLFAYYIFLPDELPVNRGEKYFKKNVQEPSED